MRSFRSHQGIVALLVMSLQLAVVVVPSALQCCLAGAASHSAESQVCECQHDKMPGAICPMHKNAKPLDRNAAGWVACGDADHDALLIGVAGLLSPRFTLATILASSPVAIAGLGAVLDPFKPPLAPPPRV
jgi:hypothetical protein